jgi:hypothetical protein
MTRGSSAQDERNFGRGAPNTPLRTFDLVYDAAESKKASAAAVLSQFTKQ